MRRKKCFLHMYHRAETGTVRNERYRLVCKGLPLLALGEAFPFAGCRLPALCRCVYAQNLLTGLAQCAYPLAVNMALAAGAAEQIIGPASGPCIFRDCKE